MGPVVEAIEERGGGGEGGRRASTRRAGGWRGEPESTPRRAGEDERARWHGSRAGWETRWTGGGGRAGGGRRRRRTCLLRRGTATTPCRPGVHTNGCSQQAAKESRAGGGHEDEMPSEVRHRPPTAVAAAVRTGWVGGGAACLTTTWRRPPPERRRLGGGALVGGTKGGDATVDCPPCVGVHVRHPPSRPPDRLQARVITQGRARPRERAALSAAWRRGVRATPTMAGGPLPHTLAKKRPGRTPRPSSAVRGGWGGADQKSRGKGRAEPPARPPFRLRSPPPHPSPSSPGTHTQGGAGGARRFFFGFPLYPAAR